MKFLEPQYLGALVVLPALLLLTWAGWGMAARARRRFFDLAANRWWARTEGRGRARATLGVVALCVSVASIVIALARPAHNPKPRMIERTGRDVLFLVDVSRSMLAQDLKPSRLERAKLAVRDVLDVIGGDRAGLIAFAGTAVVKCPLTTDYTFTRMALDDLSPDSVARGGTAIGDAIRTAMSQAFADIDDGPSSKRSRTLFLITDGEDHETDPLEAAKEAGAKGVRIITIGLGSEISGVPVPSTPTTSEPRRAGQPGFLEYGGKRVETRLDVSVLKSIAEATPGGVFLNVGLGNVELDQVYQRLMRSEAVSKMSDDRAMRYTELFQWAIAGALCMLMIEGVSRARE